MDFETLVGIVGGYIGMLTGFALAQLPEIMLGIFVYVKKLYERLWKRNSTEVAPTQHGQVVNNRGMIQESLAQPSEDNAQSQSDDNIRQICNQTQNSVKVMGTSLENELSQIHRRIDKMEEKINSVCFLDQQMNSMH